MHKYLFLLVFLLSACGKINHTGDVTVHMKLETEDVREYFLIECKTKHDPRADDCFRLEAEECASCKVADLLSSLEKT